MRFVFSALMRRKITYALWVMLTLVLMIQIPGEAGAQEQTPAATRIENRAWAVYPWEGQIRTTWSDWVTVLVRQVAGVRHGS